MIRSNEFRTVWDTDRLEPGSENCVRLSPSERILIEVFL